MRVAAGIVLLALLGISGCTTTIPFESPSPLGYGVSGKYWRTPYFVDTPLYIPRALSYSVIDPGVSYFGLVADFQLVSSGSLAQLVGTWYDSSTASTLHAYGMLYSDGAGWAALGPNFGEIASDPSGAVNTLINATVAVGPGGLFAADFFNSGFDTASATYIGTLWQQATNNIDALKAGVTGRAPGSNSNANFGTNVASVIDSLGRGYVFFADDASGVYETQWGQGNPTGISSSLNTLVSSPTSAQTPVNAVFDGISQVCATYEIGGALDASCEDIACSGPFTFAGPPAALNLPSLISGAASGEVTGHATTTDGNGNVMVVFTYAFFSGAAETGTLLATHLYAELGEVTSSCPGATEAWTTPTLIDTVGDGAMPASTLYKNSSGASLWPSGVNPGIAYVGSGKFLAVWIGLSCSGSTSACAEASSWTQVYSALYDPANGGWQTSSSVDAPAGDAQAVPQTAEYFDLIAHPQSLTVFGNSNGNAGFAINDIFTTDDVLSPGTAGATVSDYPEAAQVRIAQVGRWQTDDGWVGMPPVWPLPAPLSPLTYVCFNALVPPPSSDASISPGATTAGTPTTTDTAFGSSFASGAQPDCTHPLQGAILSSGDTIVVFQAEDGYSQQGPATNTLIPGNRRAAVLEFR